VSLRDSLASPDGKRRYVRRLFGTIADRYDIITVLLSYGRDRRWKARLVDMAGATSGARALDLACGTGDIAFALARRGAAVVGLDVTPRMIELARKKRSEAGGRGPGAGGRLSSGLRSPASGTLFLVGDMMALPFPASSFDIVTTGYGIRNVPDIDAALAEIRRVLRPGGVFLSLDFNRPRNIAIRATYLAYLTIVGSALGWLLHRDPDTYRYIPESIRRYPGAEAIVERLASHGFADVRYFPVLGGLMAIHIAR
jgi:demethylmenaquinone methyltransferase/2-methoxy-6-polyprenyl-1,4-benzoquinol methylase